MDFSREQRLAIWTLVGLSLIAIGVGSARRHFMKPGKVEFIEAGAGTREDLVSSQPQEASSRSNSAAGPVAVHMAGCVKKPGLYTLQEGSRIADAVKLAGGFTQDADMDAVNLAAKVEDGTQVFIPSRRQTRQLPSPRAFPTVSSSKTPGPVDIRISATQRTASGRGGKLTQPGEGVVYINSAGLEELQRLPGVGPATAQKIMDYRAQNGPFRAVEELMDVKGIGPAKLEKMRPFIRL